MMTNVMTNATPRPNNNQATPQAQKALEIAQQAELTHRALNAWAYLDWNYSVSGEQSSTDRSGPLSSIVFGIKDLFNVDSMPTKGGTRAALPTLESKESPLVSSLKAAGALIVGKTNMHEVAMGPTGENIHTGDVCNPFDALRMAGGSSGGSAVAVATGSCQIALGSDTGGSVRIPAALCGVIGFKPSYGVLSLEGALPLSLTCDHAGILARSVQECASTFEVLTGAPVVRPALARRPKFFVPRAWLKTRLSASIREAFEQSLATLATQADIVYLDDLPLTQALTAAWDCYVPIVRAEGAYVHRQVMHEVETLAADAQLSASGFSPSVFGLIQTGSEMTAVDYLAARQQRRTIRSLLDSVLASCDGFLLPTTSVQAPLRGETEVAIEHGKLPTREALLKLTLAFSMCGQSAISLPTAMKGGLPTSLQIVARRNEDAHLLALAAWVETQLLQA